MRYDPTGQPHPEMGDEVTAEGLQHIDNCPECTRERFPKADLTVHLENVRARSADLAALTMTALSPIGGVTAPGNWNQDFGRWVPTVCEICGANVFTVNVDPHMAWHERNGG